MKRFSLGFFLFLVLTPFLGFAEGLSLPTVKAGPVIRWEPFLAQVSAEGRDLLVLRRFENGSGVHYRAVDPVTLQMSDLSAAVPLQPFTWAQAEEHWAGSLYFRLRAEVKSTGALQRVSPAGVALSFDLCPSSKPLDREVIQKIIDGSPRPVPLMFCLTGKWADGHPGDLAWLDELQAQGQVKITWVNHSETHPYNQRKPLKQNFLLTPGTDLGAEVLGMEKKEAEAGRPLSVFFRFPGLVSSPALVNQLMDWGLIPLGAGSWVNKDQPLYAGLIFLMHANGNEPTGLTKFLRWLEEHRTEVASGRLKWLSPQEF